jgi:hypothetical protein
LWKVLFVFYVITISSSWLAQPSQGNVYFRIVVGYREGHKSDLTESAQVEHAARLPYFGDRKAAPGGRIAPPNH